jgi:hypothetical protein
MLYLLGATAKETQGISEQQNMLPHLNDKICMPRALYNIFLGIQASNSAGRSSTKDNQLKHACHPTYELLHTLQEVNSEHDDCPPLLPPIIQ